MDRLHRSTSRVSRCDRFTWSVSRANKLDDGRTSLSFSGSLRRNVLGQQASPVGISGRRVLL